MTNDNNVNMSSKDTIPPTDVDSIDDLLRRARKTYKSLHGIVAISPRLIAELADTIEVLSKRPPRGRDITKDD